MSVISDEVIESVALGDGRIVVACERPDTPSGVFWQMVAARGIAVDLVAMTHTDGRPSVRTRSGGFREIVVPRRPHHEVLRDAFLSRPGASAELALSLLYGFTPEYGDALAAAAHGASLVVADGALAAPALQRHTSLPLLVDAREPVGEPPPGGFCEHRPVGPAAGRAGLSATAERILVDAYRAATILRSYSPRQTFALGRLMPEAERVLTVRDRGDPVTCVGPAERRRLIKHFNLERRPLLLALGLSREIGEATGARLTQLAQDLPVRVVTSAPAAELPELLALASAALVLDDGPGPRGDLLTYARGGVPLVAEAGALADAGLGTELAILADDYDSLTAAVRAALADDAPLRVAEAARVATDADPHQSAAELLADPRVADLLQWQRPLRRRRRRYASTDQGAVTA